MIFDAAIGLLSQLLCLLPSGLTGRVAPKARRLVNDSLANNPTGQELRFNLLERVLLAGGNRPLAFAVGAGVLSALIAALSFPRPEVGWLGLQPPPFPDGFTLASFFGTAWAVQATMVALVYPIVITFVTILLQRRASARAALSVYLLDSGVLPAGTSSLLLVAVMAVQYFASLYAGLEWFVWAMAFNGAWLVINLALTGYFLVRTVRFIQDEEGHNAFVRLAVNSVFRQQLTTSLAKHLVVSAPKNNAARFPALAGDTSSSQLSFHRYGEGRAEVTRTFARPSVLVDVHLHLLGWVYRRWVRRAESFNANAADSRPANLIFPLGIDEQTQLRQDICAVERGPRLTGVERLLVKLAFVFRRPPARVLAADVSAMLGELAAGVQSLAEARRFTEAREALRGLIRMHVTLLRACEEPTEGTVQNVASVVVSPLGWGSRTFNADWLRPYRSLAVAAVQALEDDTSLFESVSYAATNIVRGAGPIPAKMVAEVLVVPKVLAYQLGIWWVRQMQLAAAGTTPPLTLPEPKGTTYERALISFIGAWNSIDVELMDATHSDEVRWWSTCNRVQAYVSHMDDSAKLLWDAVRRNDECAALWLSDSFLKWWGNRAHELDTGHLEDYPQWDAVRLSIVDDAWLDAQDRLHYLSGEKPSLETAMKVAHVALKRYWEALRLSLCAVLLEAGHERSDLVHRVVASLLAAKPFHAGGSCDAEPLVDRDAVLAAILEICFGDQAVRRRLDGFAEKLRWEGDEPKVPGWIYGGTVSPWDVRSHTWAWNTILSALKGSRRPAWRASKTQVETWWRDSATLAEVGRFAEGLARGLRTKDTHRLREVVSRLRLQLCGKPADSFARAQLARGLWTIAKHAATERTLLHRSQQVNPKLVQRWAKAVSALAFGPSDLKGFNKTFCSIKTEPSVVAPERSLRLTGLTKEQFVGDDVAHRNWHVEREALHVRERALAFAFSDAVQRDAFQEVRGETDESFLKAIVEACKRLDAAGEAPLVLVPPGPLTKKFRAYNWNRPGLLQLPPGITLSYRNGREPAYAYEFLNNWPVVSFATPGSKCFVVASSSVQELRVLGNDTDGGLRCEVEVTGDNSVDIVLKWNAGLLRTGTSV
jgi:hypothetical protein